LPVDPQWLRRRAPRCFGLPRRQRQRKTQGTIPPNTRGARVSLSPKPEELYTNARRG
jgi:hypothetical protein